MPDLVLDPDLGSVSTSGDVAERVARRAGWADADVDRVVIGTIEAVGNAVEHGPHSPIHVSFVPNASRSRIVVEVADGGAGPRANRLSNPSLPDEAAPGGRGLYILQALADEVAVTDGVLRLTFERRAPG